MEPIISDERTLCQQLTPDSLEYLDFTSGVLFTAYNISNFNGKSRCSLRLDYDNHTVWRHINLNPNDRKHRNGIIYQLARDTHNFPIFIDWDSLVNHLCEVIIDFAQITHAPLLVSMESVITEPITWIWPPYIPEGKLTLVEGDPGEGKSHFCLAVATPITLEKPILPGMKPQQLGNVLIASAEDGLADTLKPRLEKLGANCNYIKAINGLFVLDERGVAMLENYIYEVNPRLVIIDPISAYMGTNISSNQSNHVRGIMSQLARLAEEYKTAIIGIRHLNKGSANTKAIYRGAGSIDFTGAARSVLLLGSDPETQEKAIVHIKCNLAPKGKSIAYSLEDGGFYWRGETSITAEDLLSIGTPGALGEAEALLREILMNGDVEADTVYKEAEKRDVKQRTLKSAKKNLGIESYNVAEKGKRGAGTWYWRYSKND